MWSKMAKSLAEMKIKIKPIVTQFILRKCKGKFHMCAILTFYRSIVIKYLEDNLRTAFIVPFLSAAYCFL